MKRRWWRGREVVVFVIKFNERDQAEVLAISPGFIVFLSMSTCDSSPSRCIDGLGRPP